MRRKKALLMGIFISAVLVPHLAGFVGLDIDIKPVPAPPVSMNFTIFPPSESGFTLKFDSRRQGQCSAQVLWPVGVKKKLFPAGKEFVAIGILGPAKPFGATTGPVSKQYIDKSAASVWEGVRIDFNPPPSIATIVTVKFPQESIKALEIAGIQKLAVFVECRYSESGATESSDTHIDISDIKSKHGDTARERVPNVPRDAF